MYANNGASHSGTGSFRFATAYMVIFGWRLSWLADLLRENDLATDHVLPKRYADLDRRRPCVSSIIITPISRSPS